ncbi:rod-determining factor RdfA [Halorubrum aethiopicum]|uniref:rod-determining factor RdfA n=1 Tax=Halorubrum aethiopicum TaxID=1758255 RepID=UPI00082D7788|nr:rod-determining factor RdfA [Halorubrum aethiopicum]
MSDGTRSRGTKVARLIDEYDLSGTGARLEAAWTGTSGERTSLRDLADEFNERLLEVSLREANVSPRDFEVTGTYEALREGSSSERTRARRRLEREGIDVEALSSDFVTHQAIHTYLRKDREARLPDEDEDVVERKIETLEKLQGRVAVVTETTIESLASAEELDHPEYDILVDVQAICSKCGSNHSVGELFRQGGCQCEVLSD